MSRLYFSPHRQVESQCACRTLGRFCFSRHRQVEQGVLAVHWSVVKLVTSRRIKNISHLQWMSTLKYVVYFDFYDFQSKYQISNQRIYALRHILLAITTISISFKWQKQWNSCENLWRKNEKNTFALLCYYPIMYGLFNSEWKQCFQTNQIFW